MTALRTLLAWLRLGRPTDSGVCGCSHPASAHLHFRPGTDCGLCGPRRCDRYEPIDLALQLAPAPLVTVLQALADRGRRP